MGKKSNENKLEKDLKKLFKVIESSGVKVELDKKGFELLGGNSNSLGRSEMEMLSCLMSKLKGAMEIAEVQSKLDSTIIIENDCEKVQDVRVFTKSFKDENLSITIENLICHSINRYKFSKNARSRIEDLLIENLTEIDLEVSRGLFGIVNYVNANEDIANFVRIYVLIMSELSKCKSLLKGKLEIETTGLQGSENGVEDVYMVKLNRLGYRSELLLELNNILRTEKVTDERSEERLRKLLKLEAFEMTLSDVIEIEGGIQKHITSSIIEREDRDTDFISIVKDRRDIIDSLNNRLTRISKRVGEESIIKFNALNAIELVKEVPKSCYTSDEYVEMNFELYLILNSYNQLGIIKDIPNDIRNRAYSITKWGSINREISSNYLFSLTVLQYAESLKVRTENEIRSYLDNLRTIKDYTIKLREESDNSYEELDERFKTLENKYSLAKEQSALLEVNYRRQISSLNKKIERLSKENDIEEDVENEVSITLSETEEEVVNIRNYKILIVGNSVIQEKLETLKNLVKEVDFLDSFSARKLTKDINKYDLILFQWEHSKHTVGSNFENLEDKSKLLYVKGTDVNIWISRIFKEVYKRC